MCKISFYDNIGLNKYIKGKNEMSSKLSGLLFGTLMSLVGVVLWVILSAFLGIIAGIAGAAMGLLFVWGYRKFNPKDKNNFIYIIAGAIIIVEIIISELISLAIIASMNGIDFSEALQDGEVMSYVGIDIVLGILLTGVIFVWSIIDANKKKKQEAYRLSTQNGTNQTPPLANGQVYAPLTPEKTEPATEPFLQGYDDSAQKAEIAEGNADTEQNLK